MPKSKERCQEILKIADSNEMLKKMKNLQLFTSKYEMITVDDLERTATSADAVQPFMGLTSFKGRAVYED